MYTKKKWPSGNGVQQTINALTKQDNATLALQCCDCGKTHTKPELYNYKGLRCTVCFFKFYTAEYDTTPNDATARFLVRMGRKRDDGSRGLFWTRSTKQQKEYAKAYYKANEKLCEAMLGNYTPSVNNAVYEQLETLNNIDKL